MKLFSRKPPEAVPAEGPAAPGGRGPAEQWLRRLEWTALRRLDGLLQGNYRTLWRGTGLDLADLREYQHHDDVRHIDWNVTARLQVPHVREYHEDREMSAWFLLDLSPSVDFGSGDVKKGGVAHDFVAVLARLLTRHGNRVGAVFYGTGVDGVLPARGGRLHVLQLLDRLQSPAPPRLRAVGRKATRRGRPAVPPGTRLADLLAAGEGMLRRRSTVFVVSDFISQPGWQAPLGRLAQRHDVTAVRLVDPMERQMPDLGLVTLRDAETGEQLLVDTHDAGFRQRFERIAAEREQELLQGLAAAGVDTLELATDDDLVEAILRFVELRRRRGRLAGGATALPAHLQHTDPRNDPGTRRAAA
jgi:uncharacterized protein (DUF58 family)